MTKKIIILGELNIKLLLPFGLAATQIILKVIGQLFPEEDLMQFLKCIPLVLAKWQSD